MNDSNESVVERASSYELELLLFAVPIDGTVQLLQVLLEPLSGEDGASFWNLAAERADDSRGINNDRCINKNSSINSTNIYLTNPIHPFNPEDSSNIARIV